VNFIKQFPVFSHLGWLEQQRIALLSEVCEFRKGDIIRTQGDPPDALYCLISGRVQAFLLDEDGGKIHAEFFRRGTYFGIISLLIGQPHSLTFEALNDSVILKIDKDRFHEILKYIPQLGLEFSQTLSQRIRRNILHEDKSRGAGAIISVYSPFKEAGSSTYATQLAFALKRESGRSVILVNLRSAAAPDTLAVVPFGAAPQWRQSGPLLGNILNEPDRIKSYIDYHKEAIDLVSVRFDPQDTALTQQISAFVTELEGDYHFVVVDLPNEMDDVVLKSLNQSDSIHLIISLHRQENFQLAREVIYKIEEELKGNFSSQKVQVMVSGICGTDVSFEEINNRVDYDISAKLPFIDVSDCDKTFESDYFRTSFPAETSPYGRFIRAVARQISGVRVGLVLGGGAAFGLAHIGVLRVLEEAQIPIDMVVGSSMGALIASLWVTGMKADDIAQMAREFGTQRAMLRLFDPVVPKSGLMGGRLIKSWLKKRHLADKTFYDASIPLKIVAYDLQKRQDLVLDSGLLVDAVRKSISIPGIMEPVQEKNQVIIDGGVLNPLPTNVIREQGISKVIAVNVLQSPEDVSRAEEIPREQMLKRRKQSRKKKTVFGFITKNMRLNLKDVLSPNISDIIVKSLMASEYVISQSSSEFADIVIHPDMAGAQWYEFFKVDLLIQKGEAAARAVLKDINNLCSG
ncbi:MAG: patatin-like phospholipase family protein, partial [Candidatus Omnitrophota bacterium]